MTPASPVIPGTKLPTAFEEVVFAKDQGQYLPLPAWRDRDDPKGAILMRWRLLWRERFKVLFSGDLYLWVLTFHRQLQPLKPTVDKPEVQ